MDKPFALPLSDHLSDHLSFFVHFLALLFPQPYYTPSYYLTLSVSPVLPLKFQGGSHTHFWERLYSSSPSFFGLISYISNVLYK